MCPEQRFPPFVAIMQQRDSIYWQITSRSTGCLPVRTRITEIQGHFLRAVLAVPPNTLDRFNSAVITLWSRWKSTEKTATGGTSIANSAHQFTTWKSLCVHVFLPAHTAEFSSPRTTMYLWIKKSSFSRRGGPEPWGSIKLLLCFPIPKCSTLALSCSRKAAQPCLQNLFILRWL